MPCSTPSRKREAKLSFPHYKAPRLEQCNPCGGDDKSRIITDVPKRLTAVHHLLPCPPRLRYRPLCNRLQVTISASAWSGPQSGKIRNEIFTSARAISAEPGTGHSPQALVLSVAKCRAPHRACRCSFPLLYLPSGNGTSLSQVQPPFHPLYQHRVNLVPALGSSRGLRKISSNS